MNKRNVKLENGLGLAGALLVLFSLMYASSVAISSAPLGL